ncbi:aldo/keto reductase [uncultured Martelella sp.]|uniref:aldo/keto reductase n=1 Tax=uncultured Martelella sp. TaxID=392331 RepID=UPI0029C88E32|nr:aldo/keto reductase [uncultured Martelella sp.]
MAEAHAKTGDKIHDWSVERISIGPKGRACLPMGFGGSWYIPYSAANDRVQPLTEALDAAYEAGIRHFDTAGGYGDGRSEEILGAFLASRRDQVFLASKADPSETSATAMGAAVDDSLRRLGTDFIDLYYIHWPRSDKDLRPLMQALETARQQGKIGAIGVSNFSVEQMRQVQEAGRIDVHQLGYNLLWRKAEADLIPYCANNDIDVVTYSTLAHGILTGKFGATPDLAPGDQRNRILPFRPDLWPAVYAGVEKMKALAAEVGRPLMHLAIRWTLQRPGIAAVVAGARNRHQAEQNVEALTGEIPVDIFKRMTAISDEIAAQMPDQNNLFNRKV